MVSRRLVTAVWKSIRGYVTILYTAVAIVLNVENPM